MTDTERPSNTTDHTATFRSRGVAMPFTTPWLAGARIRESDRTGIELVVPNPSGGRGVYVLQWRGVCELCHPTVHDTMLFRRCASLVTIDPASVRNTALDVTLEGYAGTDAAIAAEAALVSDEAGRLRAQFRLLNGVLDQIDPDGALTVSPQDRTAAFDRRASAVLHRVAASLGRSAADLAAGLAVAGTAFAATGVASDDDDARIPRLLARLRGAGSDLAGWLESEPGRDVSGLGRAVVTALSLICDCGDTMLGRARSGLADPLALLGLWVRHGTGIVARAGRCDWLLDGWERIALLWLSAQTHAAKRAVLLEMASLLPALPREAKEWTDTPIPVAAMEQTFTIVSLENAWRTGGAAFNLIARNEKLLAMSS